MRYELLLLRFAKHMPCQAKPVHPTLLRPDLTLCLIVLLVLQERQSANENGRVSVAAASLCNMSIKTNFLAQCVGLPLVTAATQNNPRVNE